MRGNAMRFEYVLIGTGLSSAVAATTARAATVVTYNNFAPSSASTLALNGFASVGVTSTAGDTNTMQLTPSGGSFVFGTAFSKTPLQAGAGFSTKFQFRMTDPAGISDGTEVGADGLTFTVQNVSSSAGQAGVGIGYGGINNSVAVKYDTFQNTDENDPSTNYLGIATDGDLNNADYPHGQVNVTPDWDNGSVWTSWIDYDGTALSIYAIDSATAAKPAVPLLTYDLNLTGLTGSAQDYVGFTSAGGAASENTYLLNWTYYDYYNPSVPEPASASALAGVAAVGLLGRRSRVRAARR